MDAADAYLLLQRASRGSDADTFGLHPENVPDRKPRRWRDWPGDATGENATMKIDYIRAFSNNSSIHPPSPFRRSPRLTAADIRFMAQPPRPRRCSTASSVIPAAFYHTDCPDEFLP